MLVCEKEYNFYGYQLELYKHKEAFWAKIKTRRWEATTSYPVSCPTRALMSAELIVLKRRLQLLSDPGAVFDVRLKKVQGYRVEQHISCLDNAANRALFGENTLGSNSKDFVVDINQYQKFLECARDKGFHAGFLELKDLNGEPIKTISMIEIINSPISLTRRMQGRIIEIVS